MKKIPLLIVFILVFIFADGAFSEATVKELEDGVELPSGIYYVGEDIKAGKYIVTSIEDKNYAHIIIFESKEKYIDYNELINDYSKSIKERQEAIKYIFENISISGIGSSYRLSLEDGMVLSIMSAPDNLRIRPSTSPFQP